MGCFCTMWVKNSQEMWETGSRKNIIPFFSEYVPSGLKVADIELWRWSWFLEIDRSGI